MSSLPAQPHAPEPLFENRTERNRLLEDSLKWLRENKHNYAGRWIALHGSHLLAVGTTAKDLYSQIGAQVSSPFVARIEDNDLPFAQC